MEDFIQGTLSVWVAQWGYLAVFMGILVENAGVPLPGETIIVLASVMASQGLLRVEYVLLAAVFGGVIGPNLGYWVGKRGGRPLLVRMASLVRLSEAELQKTEVRFLKHSDLAIFFGRFVAFLRIFAGPIAGVMRMPYPRFFIFNALGSLVWASVVVGLAYVLGAHVAVLLRNLGVTVLVILCLVALVAGLRLHQKRKAEALLETIEDSSSSEIPAPLAQEPVETAPASQE